MNADIFKTDENLSSNIFYGCSNTEPFTISKNKLIQISKHYTTNR